MAPPSSMRAWEYDSYGRADVLKLREVATPVPSRGELLVRVRAAALNPKDGLFRRGKFKALSGKKFPKKTGCDWAGEVAAIGPGVTGWSVGDRAWGNLDEFTFLRGTLAEYAITTARECGPLPAGLAFEDAAGIPLAAQTSLQALRDLAKVRAGDEVLIHGASGGVGVFAIQLAVELGARVTTTSSPKNFELCRSLGAQTTLDYATGEAFSAKSRFRVIFDAIGNQRFGAVKPSLQRGGVYVTTVPSARNAIDVALSSFSSRRAKLVAVRSNTADLEHLGRLVLAGKLRPVIDETYSFEDVPKAFARLESRRARGKLIVRGA